MVTIIDAVSVAGLFYICIGWIGDGAVGEGDAIADSGNIAFDGRLHIVEGKSNAIAFGVIGDTVDGVQRDVLDGQMGDNEENVDPRAGCGKGAIALDGHILGAIAVYCDGHMARGGQLAVSLNNNGCIVGDANGSDTILGIVAAVFNNGIVQREGAACCVPSDGAAFDVRTVDLATIIEINATHRHLCTDKQRNQQDKKQYFPHIQTWFRH